MKVRVSHLFSKLLTRIRGAELFGLIYMHRHKIYCRAATLSHLPELLTTLGASSDAMFEAAGLSPKAVKRKDFVSWVDVCDLLEDAAKRLNEPNLGILWAQSLPADNPTTGPMAFLAAVVPDMQTYIDMGAAYQKIHTNGVSYNYSICEDTQRITGRMTFHPNTPPCRQMAEHIFTIVKLGMVTFFPNIKNLPLSVQFQHRRPEDTRLHEEIFGCPITFDAQHTEMSYDLSVLDTKLGRNLKVMRPLLNLFFERQVAKLAKKSTSFTSLVETIIPSIFGMGHSDINSAALALNVSPKKLPRLLQDEDTNYSIVLDSVRSSMAKRLLIESDVPISRLAALLDYASSVSFSHACKRWFGQPPREYRKTHAPQSRAQD